MRARGLVRLSALAAAIVLLVGSAAVVGAQSREQSRGDIAYWRTRYQELQPTEDPRVARAQDIFQRVVQVAGKRPGVVPRLFITARDPWDIVLPIALPDGWIVLSKGVLDICYQEAARGDDRLAFVVAHEIAHQLNDDFWHMRFFRALEASQGRAQVPPEFLEELRRTSRTPEHVLARELQPAGPGTINAAMPGSQPSAIIAEGPGVNFFADWVRALDPERIRGVATGPLRPTPQERADALRAHLRRVANTTALFQVGLWFSYAGDYPQAIQAFEAFRA